MLTTKIKNTNLDCQRDKESLTPKACYGILSIAVVFLDSW